MVPVFVLLVWLPRDGRFVHPPGWWVALIGCIGGATFAAILAGLALAALMKCEECGRRPTIVWDIRALRAAPRSEWRALRNDFFPPELRSRSFQCAHCKARFQLGYLAPKT
jgi:hypothetical protein